MPVSLFNRHAAVLATRNEDDFTHLREEKQEKGKTTAGNKTEIKKIIMLKANDDRVERKISYLSLNHHK